MDYVVSIAETNLASRMAAGTIRAYNQALTLHLMPINLIGVAISTATFPSLTERLAAGRVDLFTKELRNTIRVIMWIILPVGTIAFFARGYVVNFIKEGGDPLMANLLGALVVAIIFRSIYHIAARGFYAQQDTKTPLYVSIFAIALNVGLAVWFTMGLDWGAYGLAWAQSIVALVEVILLFVLISRRLPDLFDTEFMHVVWRTLTATAMMGVVSYMMVNIFQLQDVDQKFLETFPKFIMIVVISLGSYVWFSRILGLKEADPVIKRIRVVLFGKAR
jgi:putative peptidoglycan lipid II flippase